LSIHLDITNGPGEDSWLAHYTWHLTTWDI